MLSVTRLVLATSLVVSLAGCASTPAASENTEPHAAARAGVPERIDGWQTWRRGRLAAVHVARAAYTTADSQRFFMRVRIENLTDRPIGVDLRHYDHVVYPNQWGALDTPQRGIIDEGRIIPLPLDSERHAQLVRDHAAGALTRIEPRGSVDYFREFNASRAEDLVAAGGRYVFVSMDGQIFVTDGGDAESLNDDWRDDDGPGDVILTAPIELVPMSADALVVDD